MSVKEMLLEAALPHVVFDGWSDATFDAACKDAGIDMQSALHACPKRAFDLAVAYHVKGDAIMQDMLQNTDLDVMRIRERVTFAVRTRMEAVSDKDILRKGIALFSLPHTAGEGTRLVWNTCDKIWTALGDPSTDGNWYSKRAILSGVYSSVVIYWLGDTSEGSEDTWAFLDRRIDDVMRIEKAKAGLRGNPLTKFAMNGFDGLMGAIKAPNLAPRTDLPGHWGGGKK